MDQTEPLPSSLCKTVKENQINKSNQKVTECIQFYRQKINSRNLILPYHYLSGDARG